MKKFRKILPMLLLATLAILFQSAHTGGARAAGKWLTLPRGMRTIEACAFENCLDATGVIIPKGVTAIGANAFRGCENLAEAYIPDSVTAIGAGAFCGCDALVSLVLPDGLTQISDACFMRCENLCSLVIPTGVTRIGAGAFEFAGLAELTLPSTVTEIGERAFYFCTDLTRVTIPSGVKKIGADAFHADDSVTILGVEGSYAQRYAQDNGLPFQTASVRISAQPADATIAAGDTAAFVVRALGIGLTYQWEENRGDGWKTCALAGSGTAVLRVPYAQAVDQTQYRCTVTDASKKRATSTAAVLRVAPIVIRVQPEDAIACEGEDAYFTLIADGSGLSYRWQTDAGSGWTDCAPQDGRANQLCVHSDTPGGSRFRCLLRDAYGNTLASDAACLWAASGGLSYTAYPDTAVITGYTGRRTDVVIPPTIKGLKVVSIQPEAFRGRTDISSVVIPGTVSALESGSFSNCTGLKRVVISNGTKWLWDGVFRGCSALESVSIPPSVAHIDDYAFMGCGKLREVKLPAALTSLSERVFAGCESLESIWVPDNVSSIGEGAFVNCVNAATIRLPDGLVEIGQEAFSGCQSVTRLTIPQGVTQIRDWTFDNCLRLKSIVIPSGVVSIGDYAFSQCRALAGIELPKALRSLGAFAFYGDSALARIELPGGIQSVKRNCFGYCGRLETAVIGSGIGSIESCAFESCGALKAVVVPGSVVSISDDAFDSGEPTFYGEADSYAQSYAARKGLPFSQATTGILAQPRSVTALCGETVEMRVTAFGSGLSYSWEQYSDGAWQKCSLSGSGTACLRISAPRTSGSTRYRCVVKDAGGKVSVSQSATLKAADFFISAQPKNVETVEGTQVKLSVGAKCTSQFSCQWQRKSGTQWTDCASASASTLQLKAGAPTPGVYYRCVLTSASGATLYSNAARLRVTNSGFSWGAYLDSGDVEITGYSGSDQSLLVIPSVLDGKKVVSVGYMALMAHSEITQVDFPSTLVNIGYAAFQECTGLRQLALPASLKTIEAAAFGDCTELVSLVLPDGVVKVGEDQDSLLGAFENCVKLRSVVISAGMRKINARCFRCCSSLTDLVIPSNITQIGSGAFYDCDALKQVVIPGSVTRIEGNAFWGCDALTRVVIPKSVASIASAAFANCAALTICGEAGSCAQRYATENGLPFELIS